MKQDYDHLTCAWFTLLGMAKLPDCSQECPPLHPGIIHILNLIYSLQHLSHALKSYIDMCVHMQLPMWLTGKESACLCR